MILSSEGSLVAAALALGSRKVSGWSPAEEALAGDVKPAAGRAVTGWRRQILGGFDPLGERFCQIRSAAERRSSGATYTPAQVVEAMLAWSETRDAPARVVDPGCGSARFLLAAGARYPRADLVGVELDPLAAVVARANLAAAGLAGRARIVVGDYREVRLPQIDGRTAYLGNPPYVRHHLIAPAWKRWLAAEAGRRGLHRSRLAGLHVYFFLATAIGAAEGDYGAFVTAAEWLDVNYGQLVRDLFLGRLGGESIHLLEPQALPFGDAATTAAISTFEIASSPGSVRIRRVRSAGDLGNLGGGRRVRRDRLASERRWSSVTRVAKRPPVGFVELGELCRVHRGQATGANKVWIADARANGLPASVLVPTVTRARELFEAGLELTDASRLRRVIDLPVDLGPFDPADRRQIESFLRRARAAGVHHGYLARHRPAWWSVRLREPAPILATYMARRPPAFVRNRAGARHLNIAHGIYPREPLSERVLAELVRFLSFETDQRRGRTYAGGLTKFEPREMERIPVPGPELLRADSRSRLAAVSSRQPLSRAAQAPAIAEGLS